MHGFYLTKNEKKIFFALEISLDKDFEFQSTADRPLPQIGYTISEKSIFSVSFALQHKMLGYLP